MIFFYFLEKFNMDFADDPMNAMFSNVYKYVDHFYDINSNQIKVKSNKNFNYLTVGTDKTPFQCYKEYFNSTDCDEIVDKSFNGKIKIEEYIEKNGQIFFLVDVDGEKHIVTKNNIDKFTLIDFYQNNFKPNL